MAQPVPEFHALSDRASALPGSPIRALLSGHRSGPVLDLGGGWPDPALFPSDELAAVAEEVVVRGADHSLQYAPTEGLEPLRVFVAERLRRRGCTVSSDQVLLSHGSQQALYTAAALLTSRTQPVALEQPGYPGAEQAFALAEAPVVALPVTTDGWELDALRGRRFGALYVIPNHQNPTGRTASQEQCCELVRFAEQCGALVIEDDAYGDLAFDAEPARPLCAGLPTRGILLGTFSKTLCPGLRIGWMVAPRELVEPLVRLLQASSLQAGTLAQHLAYGLLQRLDWEAHLGRLRQAYARRARALEQACRTIGYDARAPGGGFFLWLDARGDATALVRRAAALGVLGVPERAFRHPGCPGPDRHLRLAFSRFDDSDQARERLRRGLCSR
ncbi:MAG: PLP-dependent aminotransferase family protein [Polyangiaceae bacterium]|nr:PLP-dependent aminotransferase family protein [Polyangiaceae bacterium]